MPGTQPTRSWTTLSGPSCISGAEASAQSPLMHPAFFPQYWKNATQDTVRYCSLPASESSPRITVGWTQHKRVITVVSQLFALSSADWSSLIDVLFEICPDAREIRFSAVRILNAQVPSRLSVTGLAYDHIVSLPGTSDAYAKSLGTKTRKHLPYFWRKLRQECPSLTYVELHQENISRLDIARIVEYGRDRMKGKGISPGIDSHYEERLFRVSQEFGVLGVLECDKEVIAGTITFRIGTRQFLWVISHKDAAPWSRWSPGLVCLWRNIEAAIDSGIRDYHLLWGDSSYKARMGAKRVPLYSGTVHRSRWRSYRTLPRKAWGLGIPAAKRRVRRVLDRRRKSSGSEHPT